MRISGLLMSQSGQKIKSEFQFAFLRIHFMREVSSRKSLDLCLPRRERSAKIFFPKICLPATEVSSSKLDMMEME